MFKRLKMKSHEKSIWNSKDAFWGLRGSEWQLLCGATCSRRAAGAAGGSSSSEDCSKSPLKSGKNALNGLLLRTEIQIQRMAMAGWLTGPASCRGHARQPLPLVTTVLQAVGGVAEQQRQQLQQQLFQLFLLQDNEKKIVLCILLKTWRTSPRLLLQLPESSLSRLPVEAVAAAAVCRRKLQQTAAPFSPFNL